MASSGGNGLIDLLSGGLGSYFINKAGEAVGAGQVGPDEAIWNWPGSGSNWGPAAQAKAYPYVNPSMPPAQEEARQSSQRIHRDKEETRRIHDQVLETDRVQTADAQSWDALHYPQAQYMEYGDNRNPFQPLPGMQHNPDPNQDPFAAYGPVGKQMGAYQRARNAGMDHDQALKHARNLKPQQPMHDPNIQKIQNMQPIPQPPGNQVVPNYPQAKKRGTP